MQIIRWGVLSTAKIGVNKVIPAMQLAKNTEVVAIASQQLNKAKDAAEALNIPRAYGSYEELLQDPDIDAIYNPLPNHLHISWTIKALTAGKHVLCEKPFANNTADMRKLIDVNKKAGKVVGEAFMIKASSQWQTLLKMIRAGDFGDIHAVHGHFFYNNTDAGNIRNRPDALGGALMDIGCYPLMVARMVFQSEPIRVMAAMAKDAEFHTDKLTSALLQFPQGHCTFSVGTQTLPFQRITIMGTRKHAEICVPFNTPNDQVAKIKIHAGNILSDQEEILEFAPIDQYTAQAENFAQAILQNLQPHTPLTDSYYNAAAIEALIESATTGQWATPAPLAL